MGKIIYMATHFGFHLDIVLLLLIYLYIKFHACMSATHTRPCLYFSGCLQHKSMGSILVLGHIGMHIPIPMLVQQVNACRAGGGAVVVPRDLGYVTRDWRGIKHS